MPQIVEDSPTGGGVPFVMSALTRMLVSRTIRTHGVYFGIDNVDQFLLV